MSTLIIILALVFSFIGGYQFCLIRWRPKDLCEVARIMTELQSEEITPEEALDRIDQITL